MTTKKCLTILQNQKNLRGIEPWSPMWQAKVLPLDHVFISALLAKIVLLILKEGGPTGPPLGSQVYEIYVGSNRVNGIMILRYEYRQNQGKRIHRERNGNTDGKKHLLEFAGDILHLMEFASVCRSLLVIAGVFWTLPVLVGVCLWLMGFAGVFWRYLAIDD